MNATSRTQGTIAALAFAGALAGCLGGGGGGGSSSGAATAAPAPAAAPGAAAPAPGAAAPAPTSPVTTPVSMPTAQPTTAGDAVRFLEQTSFGPTEASIQEVMQKGTALALEEQFAKPMSGYGAFTDIDPDPRKGCPDTALPNPDICYRENYTVQPLQRMFFANAVTASDQLRQRVAFALSQILVISGTELETMGGIGYYQQMLMNFAFANFRDLMYEVTLSPAMGEYLDMVNNPKPDPARNIEPNENYARELLQLFTVGECQLNADGSCQLDAAGLPVPTYDQDTVENLARAFTGWTYPPRPGVASKFPNPPYYLGRMVPFTAQHDTAVKTLFGNRTIAPGQTPVQDVNSALDIIFNHANTGTFIGKQLIEHLVTSNPSPAYVARVTAAFNNNGQGVRGDMKAVLRAILLDAEARGDLKTVADYGKLREPALLVASVLRALNGASDGVYLLSQSSNMGQNVFQAPSVFNFYPPNFVAPGTTLAGPPFKIMLTGTILNRANFVDRVVMGANIGADNTVAGSTGTRINLQPFQGLAANPDAAGQLLDRFNLIFMHNTLSPQARQALLTAINAYPATDTLGRVRQAAYLIATSAQYQVEQ
ncbi:MAG TPA: DUF1800 domain-containing protein [Burkholderiales bacterium]|nr:DUF1800 domain-containing protein [Burkholderiales bacterium]